MPEKMINLDLEIEIQHFAQSSQLWGSHPIGHRTYSNQRTKGKEQAKKGEVINEPR